MVTRSNKSSLSRSASRGSSKILAAKSRTSRATSASTSASRGLSSRSSASSRGTSAKITSSRSSSSKNFASKGKSKSSLRAISSRYEDKQSLMERGIKNLNQLLLDEIEDLYSAEIQIIDQLPDLIRFASDPKLKDALNQHLKETKNQVNRLRRIFSLLEKNPTKQFCKGMQGILEEGQELITKSTRGPAKDACIIAAAQKVEHYEICGYGTARSHARQLKLDEVAHLLRETLEEEVNADKILTKLAEGSFFTAGINEQAEEFATAVSR